MAKRTVLMGQRLWQQAQRDIDVARRLLQPHSYYAAANFAHQAAEKALKGACWHLRGEEPPWNHDLVQSAALLAQRVGAVPAAVQAAVERLQPMLMESRYPSGDLRDPIPADLFEETDALAAIDAADEVMKWVEMLLQRPPGKIQRKTN